MFSKILIFFRNFLGRGSRIPAKQVHESRYDRILGDATCEADQLISEYRKVADGAGRNDA